MSISIFLVACCVQAAGAAYSIYGASLAAMDGSGVTGEVTVFITPRGLLGVGSASGFAADWDVHIYDGTSCTPTPVIGSSFIDFTPKVGSEFSNENGGFSFSETTALTGISGKPFIVQNNAGTPVACGQLAFKTGVMSASLAPVSSSGVTGELAIFTTATMIIGAGRAIGLEASLSGTGTANNTRGIAVHSGEACTDEASQGDHYYDTSGSDPWASIGYSTTSSAGSTDFMFAVTTSLKEIASKPFIVHNNGGGRVACGLIGGPFDVFTADLTELASSGVTGDVTVFVTPEGLLGVGNVSGQAAGGMAIHAGTSCSAQGARYKEANAQDPWTSSTYPSTEPSGEATYSFSVNTLAKDILGKPFIVRNDGGDLVACGILARKTGAKTATLAPLTGAMPNGRATIYTTATKIVGAGRATGLEASLSGTGTASNSRSIAVTSGAACTDATSQGSHYYDTSGSDPWASIGYGTTDSTGTATFVFSITTSLVDIVDKPLIMYNDAGARKACGLVVAPSTSSTTGSTTGSGNGTDTGSTDTGSTVTSRCSGMPAFGMIVVLFAGMLSICAEL